MLLLSCFGRAVTRAALFGRFVPPKTCYFPPNICSLRPVPHGARAGTTSAGAAPRVRDPGRRAPGIGVAVRNSGNIRSDERAEK